MGKGARQDRRIGTVRLRLERQIEDHRVARPWGTRMQSARLVLDAEGARIAALVHGPEAVIDQPEPDRLHRLLRHEELHRIEAIRSGQLRSPGQRLRTAACLMPILRIGRPRPRTGRPGPCGRSGDEPPIPMLAGPWSRRVAPESRSSVLSGRLRPPPSEQFIGQAANPGLDPGGGQRAERRAVRPWVATGALPLPLPAMQNRERWPPHLVASVRW